MVVTRRQRQAAEEANINADEYDLNVPVSTTKSKKNASEPSPSSPSKPHDHAHHDHRGCPAHILKEAMNGDTASTTKGNEEAESQLSQMISYGILLLLAFITYATYPGSTLGNKGLDPTIHTVFYYGWISAISTGFGVLPLCFVREMKEYWVGVSNAIAAGMMCAASYSLFVEGCTFHDDNDDSSLSPVVRTAIGCAMGLLFILGTKSFVDSHEDVKVGSLSGADTRKILLIVFVMTLHSFSEGVGIGVSFGGEHGNELGVFISASLAVHNIPEGLAVAIVLLPRKVSKATAAIWCVVTSLPQPLMAVPAFIFVHSFLPLLPVGLGFAGGAMMWVAFMELLIEAYEDTDLVTTGVASTLALGAMLAVQRTIEDNH
jgi:ZIP family zinc transporter